MNYKIKQVQEVNHYYGDKEISVDTFYQVLQFDGVIADRVYMLEDCYQIILESCGVSVEIED